jgi:hypothetical protein
MEALEAFCESKKLWKLWKLLSLSQSFLCFGAAFLFVEGIGARKRKILLTP